MRAYALMALMLVFLMAIFSVFVPVIIFFKTALLAILECWLNHYQYSLVPEVLKEYFTLNKTLRLIAAGAWCGFLVSLPVCWKLWRSIPRYDPLDKYFK